MQHFLKKIDFQKYGVIYTCVLGILAYCCIVLHFTAVYWNAPPEAVYSTALTDIPNLQLYGDTSTVVQDESAFRFSLSGNNLAITSGIVPLQSGETAYVTADISGDAGIRVQFDLYKEGYDNPEQETGLVLDGNEQHFETKWNLGQSFPEEVEFRVFAFAPDENVAAKTMEVRNVQIQIQRKGSVFAPVYMTSLILGVFFAVAFVFTLRFYLSTKEKKNEEIPFAEKGIIYGYLKLKLIPQLQYSEGKVTGSIQVLNKGKSVQDLSAGKYPVNVGISIVDASHTLINQDYARLSIRHSGILRNREKVELTVALGDLRKYAQKNYQLAFTPVQEGVAWDRSSAVYFPLR